MGDGWRLLSTVTGTTVKSVMQVQGFSCFLGCIHNTFSLLSSRLGYKHSARFTGLLKFEMATLLSPASDQLPLKRLIRFFRQRQLESEFAVL